MTQQRMADEKKLKPRKPDTATTEPVRHPPSDAGVQATLASLQSQVGNRAVQRLIAQRSGDGPFELDDSTAARINRERGGGQPLDSSVQTSIGEATGHDFSGVKVHTSPDSDALNHELGAKAFTTGQDVFFSEGAYEPHSTSGQELLAHELTHVVQQGSGSVGGGSRMTVNAPGDAYEQEADAVASAYTAAGTMPTATAQAGIQRQGEDEEEEEVQMQPEDEEEIQRQAQEDEEETVQMQADDEEEEDMS